MTDHPPLQSTTQALLLATYTLQVQPSLPAVCNGACCPGTASQACGISAAWQHQGCSQRKAAIPVLLRGADSETDADYLDLDRSVPVLGIRQCSAIRAGCSKDLGGSASPDQRPSDAFLCAGSSLLAGPSLVAKSQEGAGEVVSLLLLVFRSVSRSCTCSTRPVLALASFWLLVCKTTLRLTPRMSRPALPCPAEPQPPAVEQSQQAAEPQQPAAAAAQAAEGGPPPTPPNTSKVPLSADDLTAEAAKKLMEVSSSSGGGGAWRMAHAACWLVGWLARGGEKRRQGKHWMGHCALKAPYLSVGLGRVCRCLSVKS